MTKMLFGIPALLLVAACGTTSGGVRGEVAFRATGHASKFTSARAPQQIAACFEKSAKLLPFGIIAHDPIDDTPVYRLRYQEYWFEQIAFRHGRDGGTIVEVMSSGNYDRGWTAMLVRDRLGPLGECLAPATNNGPVVAGAAGLQAGTR